MMVRPKYVYVIQYHIHRQKVVRLSDAWLYVSITTNLVPKIGGLVYSLHHLFPLANATKSFSEAIHLPFCL